MKRVIFVRHAEAEPKVTSQSDLERKLTADGRKRAQAVARGLAVLCEQPVCVMSSLAVRAIETASELSVHVHPSFRLETAALNPGCGGGGFRSALAEAPRDAATVILVGHEPDLGEMIGEAIGPARIRLKFRKLGCAVVEWDDSQRAQLTMVLPPSVLEKICSG